MTNYLFTKMYKTQCKINEKHELTTNLPVILVSYPRILNACSLGSSIEHRPNMDRKSPQNRPKIVWDPSALAHLHNPRAQPLAKPLAQRPGRDRRPRGPDPRRLFRALRARYPVARRAGPGGAGPRDHAVHAG